MKAKAKKILIGIAVIAIVYGVAHTFYSQGADKSKKQKVVVTVASAQQKSLEQTIQVVGTVQAYATVAVKSHVGGTIARVSFQEGQVVKANDELFQIDPRPFTIALQQAKADLAKDEAQLDNANLQLQRYAKLAKKGFVAEDVYNQARSNVSSLTATVAAEQAKVAAAQLQLDYSTIRAPISGITGNQVLQVGNLVKENDANPLVTINQVEPIFINFALPEQYLPQVQQLFAKGPVQLIAQLGNAKQIKEYGQLFSLNNEIDTATGTIKLKGSFANKQHLLWPGQYVTVILPIAKFERALVIPTQAIQQGQQGVYVYLINDKQKAQYRLVKTGMLIGNETIILEGLNIGDQVVTDGQFRLQSGTRVVIKNTKS